MSTEYDTTTAFHYSSYRPSLHNTILKTFLGKKSFNSGLDIGCGTGQSAVALVDFCDNVKGIDPSIAMISKGIVHPNVRYSVFDKNHIDFDDTTFDISTLAGSLWYAKSQQLLNEIVRVGAKNGLIFIYDFEVLLKDILTAIGFKIESDFTDSYNHKEDFSGLNTTTIRKLDVGSERVSIQIDNSNLAHLLLSVKEQYAFLANRYDSENLYAKMVDRLSRIANSNSFTIEANTFFTAYRII